jgi:hypothetical protein
VEEAQVLGEERCWIGWRESVNPGCQYLPWKLKAAADSKKATERGRQHLHHARRPTQRWSRSIPNSSAIDCTGGDADGQHRSAPTRTSHRRYREIASRPPSVPLSQLGEN